MSGNRNRSDRDPFYRDVLFTDLESILSWNPSPLSSAISDCLVVLDTNVLLAPYQVDSKSLGQIITAYRTLADNDRLFVPAQVLREYAANRSGQILALRQRVRSASQRVSLPTLNVPSVVMELSDFQAATDALDKLVKAKADFEAAVKDLSSTIEGWVSDDPVRHEYASVLAGRSFQQAISNEDLVIDHDHRVRHSRPPGFKDSDKEDGGIGDIIIWHTILRLGSEFKHDLLFVTNERKGDWWEKSEDKTITPRTELLEEYRGASGGHTFHLASLSTLLRLLDVSPSVVNEVEEAESTQQSEAEFPFESQQDLDAEIGAVRTLLHTGKQALSPWIIEASIASYIGGFLLRHPVDDGSTVRVLLDPGLWRTESQYEQLKQILQWQIMQLSHSDAEPTDKVVFIFATEQPRPADLNRVMSDLVSPLSTPNGIGHTWHFIPPRLAAATTYPIFRDLVFGKKFDKYVIQGRTD